VTLVCYHLATITTIASLPSGPLLCRPNSITFATHGRCASQKSIDEEVRKVSRLSSPKTSESLVSARSLAAASAVPRRALLPADQASLPRHRVPAFPGCVALEPRAQLESGCRKHHRAQRQRSRAGPSRAGRRRTRESRSQRAQRARARPPPMPVSPLRVPPETLGTQRPWPREAGRPAADLRLVQRTWHLHIESQSALPSQDLNLGSLVESASGTQAARGRQGPIHGPVAPVFEIATALPSSKLDRRPGQTRPSGH